MMISGSRLVLRLVFVVVSAVFVLPATAQDLSDVYPSSIYYSEEKPEPLAWRCTPDDVWEVSGFQFEFEKKLKVKLGKSTVVIGRYEENALWAAVLPAKPTKLNSTLGGNGEKIKHIWLRFNPSEVGELFPERTIRGRGKQEARLVAFRIASLKLKSFWADTFEQADDDEEKRLSFTGYRPTCPPKGTVVLDMDMEGGIRRVYTADTRKNEIRLRGAYLTKPLPELPKVARRDAMQAYDRALKISQGLVNSGVELREGVVWKEHEKECKRGLTKAADVLDVAVLLHALFDPFQDPSFRMKAGDEYVPAFRTDIRRRNASFGGVERIMGDITWHEGPGRKVAYGSTRYGVGYMRLDQIKTQEDVDTLDEVLEELGGTWGLILDLRYGLQGETPMVESFGGRFVAETTPYARHAAYGADGLEKGAQLVLEPRGPWPYEGVVYALVGARTSGPGERVALMVNALPKSETLGEPTYGLGLNADWEELINGISIFHRAGLTFDHEDSQMPVDGLMPSKPILVDPLEFGEESDPVLYKALEEIYLVPHEERLIAKTGEQFEWPDAYAGEEDGEAGEGEEEGGDEDEEDEDPEGDAPGDGAVR